MITFETAIIAAVGGACLVTCILLVSLYWLHHRLRRECREGLTAAQESEKNLSVRLNEAQSEIARMGGCIRDLEEQVRLAAGAQAKTWSNIDRRVQAVRMLRNGTSADRVAAELAMTPGEVDLIRSVQRLTGAGDSANEFAGPSKSANRN
jgi:hypothetical protein